MRCFIIRRGFVGAVTIQSGQGSAPLSASRRQGDTAGEACWVVFGGIKGGPPYIGH